ncbi:hypothetical protein AB3N58_15200 [Leptospira sp. WS60.C2]
MKSFVSFESNCMFSVSFSRFFLFLLMVFLFFDGLVAKEPPSQISFTEGGIQKTFYRNPKVEAEFIDPNFINSSQNKGLGNGKWKAGWNVRPAGKPILSKQLKVSSQSKVTEVYNPNVGSGPNIVLPGLVIVSFKKEQTKESLLAFAMKYKMQFQHQYQPKLASFQFEPGYLSVEKANELLNDSIVMEAYPDTAVEKVLK